MASRTFRNFEPLQKLQCAKDIALLLKFIDNCVFDVSNKISLVIVSERKYQ